MAKSKTWLLNGKVGFVSIIIMTAKFFLYSLGPLVKQIKEENLLQIIDRLSEFASQQKNDELRGIASIGKVYIYNLLLV